MLKKPSNNENLELIGKPFDLNIEKILENWEISFAIREIIANALDETKLTRSKKINIYKDKNNVWHIRDYGRGLETKHLTQKENNEKMKSNDLIGRFGIGLKDAIATFHRNNIKVKITSKFLEVEKIERHEKNGFKNIKTINAFIKSPTNKNYIGTDFALINVTDNDINEAKKLFLTFLNVQIIDENKYGQIIIEQSNKGSIFINGIKVASEDNFLFSYNITSLDAKIKKALNRERTNVGRSAYSDRIQLILKNSKSKYVFNALMSEFENLSSGEYCDEITWIDIQVKLIKKLNADKNIIFITFSQSKNHIYRNFIDSMDRTGKRIILIPDNLYNRTRDEKDEDGNPIKNIDTYIKKEQENFKFDFVEIKDLNKQEALIFSKTNQIINLIFPDEINYFTLKISETMQKNPYDFGEALGLYQEKLDLIIIKRSQLKDLETYAGTLLHEVIHAKTNARDLSNDFENYLSQAIGTLVNKII